MYTADCELCMYVSMFQVRPHKKEFFRETPIETSGDIPQMLMRGSDTGSARVAISVLGWPMRIQKYLVIGVQGQGRSACSG